MCQIWCIWNVCSKLCQWLFFGAYTTSQCQLLNNISISSSSSEFRNAPYAQLFVEDIGSVDFVVDRKTPKTNIYCNNQFKDKGQVSSGKARITKRKAEKNGSKLLELNTKPDRKSEEIPLKRKIKKNMKERGTTFENTSEPGDFDTSRRITFGERIWTKRKTVLDEISV